MAMPTISVNDREVVLVSGYELKPAETAAARATVIILDETNLIRTVKNDNDAVAFGYVSGRWIPAA